MPAQALKEEAEVLAADREALKGLPPGHPKREEHAARAAALAVSKDMVAHEVWIATAQDLADALTLAEVAWDRCDLGTFPGLPTNIEDRNRRDVAVAYLVRGVWDAHSQAQARATEGGSHDRDSQSPERPRP